MGVLHEWQVACRFLEMVFLEMSPSNSISARQQSPNKTIFSIEIDICMFIDA